jgi:C_GCAxxG_C_C family probable redox protein
LSTSNSRIIRAVSCFKDSYNCTQAILSAYGVDFGLEKEKAFKVAAGFGAGMRMGETCGAVTGAIMVIGLKYFQGKTDESKLETNEAVLDFISRFKERRETVQCKALLGIDVGTPQGYAEAKEKGVFESFCPDVVKDAAEILEEIL